MTNKRGFLALSPVAVMLVVYLGGALLFGDFYRMPMWVAFAVALLYGVALLRGNSWQQRAKVVAEGVSSKGVLYMIAIFCLAGVFAASAKRMGAVDATVELTLNAIPIEYLPAGIFLAACFISMSIGTSVGTIVTLTPVVVDMPIEGMTPWLVAIVVGGAFFGDNLSFISDTTIAATQSQGCQMRDKFRTNFRLVLPAAIITLILYLCGDMPEAMVQYDGDGAWIKALPYVLVIMLAMMGIDVLVVLLIGFVASCMIGAMCDAIDVRGVIESVGEGLLSMVDLIVVTLLASAMMSVVRRAGGFDFLIQKITSKVSSRRGAEGAVVGLTALTNLCTANNTIAILTVGPIARDLSLRYAIEPRRTASLMDTTSCFVQGVIPYGAQLLMASSLAGVSPVAIIPYLYYPMLIGVSVVMSIIVSKKKRI